MPITLLTRAKLKSLMLAWLKMQTTVKSIKVKGRPSQNTQLGRADYRQLTKVHFLVTVRALWHF